MLLSILLVSGRDDEAAALLDRYGGDASAVWHYGRALVAFRREGDTPTARDRRRAALRANRRVATYLTDPDALPDHDPQTYAFGSEEEADGRLDPAFGAGGTTTIDFGRSATNP